ncbi:MAG: hypothetical protein ACR2PV_04025 [Gammaproteobacteria bacterium]
MTGMDEQFAERACQVAQKYRTLARKPIVIEFAGVPKAGKTSNIAQVQSFFKRCDFNVQTVVEMASLCPIRDKKHPNFNIWTACSTLAQLLEKTQSPPRSGDPDILFLDRGVFDAICWMRLMNENFSRLDGNAYEAIEKFLSMPQWRQLTAAVFVMVASPGESIKRERGTLIPPNMPLGSIMNEDVLGAIQGNIKRAMKEHQNFNIYKVDTSLSALDDLKKSSKYIADIVLSCVERHLNEDILHLDKNVVSDLFCGNRYIDKEQAGRLKEVFLQKGVYKPRQEVEADPAKVQAIPVVVVRDYYGKFLYLTRRENDHQNSLDKKKVIWAGGHVRKEDDTNGDAIIQCAKRELTEELRLSVTDNNLKLMGAIYVDTPSKIAQHAAIVYEWQAPSKHVGIVVSGAEFQEKRGTSVKIDKRFYPLQELIANVENKRLQEDWSVEIINQYKKQRENHDLL